ncbi:MAG TPA: acyl carrier protein [Sphingobium sp.]|uniref:acyl carrier protein n=1 Tax=Sphingobium sp. TaxID=1912891 RepID=UPI002ED4D8F5
MPITPEAILEIVVAETGLPEDSVRPDVTLAELDIASLDLASIAFEIEDRLGVEISTDDLKPDMTVAAFVEHVQSLKSA